MSHYSTGRGVEYLNRDHIDAEGYIVSRAAGSKGWLDLMARKPGQLLDVQCKSDGKLTAADWDRLLERAAWVGAIPILATRDLEVGCREFHSGPKGRRCGTVLFRLTGRYVPRAPFWSQPRELFFTDEISTDVKESQ